MHTHTHTPKKKKVFRKSSGLVGDALAKLYYGRFGVNMVGAGKEWRCSCL